MSETKGKIATSETKEKIATLETKRKMTMLEMKEMTQVMAQSDYWCCSHDNFAFNERMKGAELKALANQELEKAWLASNTEDSHYTSNNWMKVKPKQKTRKTKGQTGSGEKANGETLEAIESILKKAKEKVQKMVEEDEDFARCWRKNIIPQ